jgi:hypothetical protein
MARCALRRQTDHLALSIVVTAILPHLLKRLIDQKRPDRCMVHGRRRGIPRSGKPYDAFPSGHAMHVGAVASAVSRAYPKSAPIAWGLGGLIAATRIVLLAHWTTDVLAGLAMGALVERGLWPWSGRRTFGELGRKRQPGLLLSTFKSSMSSVISPSPNPAASSCSTSSAGSTSAAQSSSPPTSPSVNGRASSATPR